MRLPWRETVPLAAPLRDAARRWPMSPGEFERHVREREEAAFARGRHEAERFLGDQMVRQRAELLELQNGVLQSLRQQLPAVIADAERGLIDLALAAATKCVAGLPVSPELVAAVVQEALGRADQAASYQVRLHPEDLALLERINSPLLLNQVGGGNITFEGAPEVGRGGCVVRTDVGVIDARRETKLEALRESLQEL